MLELNDSVRMFRNIRAGVCFSLNIITFVIILSTAQYCCKEGMCTPLRDLRLLLLWRSHQSYRLTHNDIMHISQSGEGVNGEQQVGPTREAMME